ncbi:hypothetical protein E2562_024184 [Oryza meyeriana var. granulata]|uniref:Uncharacterized protein n=1 Tax=Oryza meyeriana var. granulata TaxID=110450 RepID=A0A6G1C049_9ORYZ|nr:hypothetical protein E2562_024184 [Oryza meyeriana var. granulata]
MVTRLSARGAVGPPVAAPPVVESIGSDGWLASRWLSRAAPASHRWKRGREGDRTRDGAQRLVDAVRTPRINAG